ncbi:MAG: hypothetical protein EBR82_50785 [Caulobacteraceae bacterium]|nr:hypothetical protein [Caulobacteraceae bacterium]
MNYSELSTAIQAYTENTSSTFVAEIPTFVQQAEQRIYNTVQFPSLRKNVVGVVQGTPTPNKYLAAPDDFLAVYSMAIITDYGTAAESYEYLLNKDVNFIRQAYPTPADTGLPRYYALFGPTVTSGSITNELSFILGPTPDANYRVELHYYYYPVSIVTDAVLNPTGTSWLGDNFDSVLLYGSLVEAYTYMKGEQDMMALYNGKYQEALALAKRLGDGMERQDAYRNGQYRQAVT